MAPTRAAARGDHLIRRERGRGHQHRATTDARRAMTADHRSWWLDDRHSLSSGVDLGSTYLTGVQALVQPPLDQLSLDHRARRHTAVFISGHEGSPLGAYDLELIDRRPLLEHRDIVLQPGVHEERAARAVQGTQLRDTLMCGATTRRPLESQIPGGRPSRRRDASQQPRSSGDRRTHDRAVGKGRTAPHGSRLRTDQGA